MATTTQVQPGRDSLSGLNVQKAAPQSQRIAALDFTKGALVLFMVFYHWTNYFIGPQWAYYEYLRFLTPSFIFITGFLVSNVYLSKYAASDTRLPKRLFTRGARLLAVFLFLNLARTLVVPLLGTGVLVQNPLTFTNVFAVFVSGNVPITGGKLVAFSILVPISYVLMFSAVLIFPYRRHKYTFHVVCAFLLSLIGALWLAGGQSANLELLTMGLLGVMAGFFSITTINDFVRHQYGLAFAYVCYTIVITVWNVPFPLLIVGVVLTVAAIYVIGGSGSKTGLIRGEVILLGKYSLLGYISQIVILQILSATFRHFSLGLADLVLSFILAFVLTIASVRMVDSGRLRATNVDRLYRAVFA